MQRRTFYNFCFLLATLLIFVAGCAKVPQVIEAPKPVEQPPQVTPQPAEQPVQPPQLPVKPGEMGAPTIIGQDGAEMILIPEGEFIMGSPEGEGVSNEHPQHTVFLDAFYIDKYEVTNAQYKQFMRATGHQAPDYWNNNTYNQPNQPVVGVSWHDAVAYCKWAGKRLPTEAELEKAARGTDGRKYPWGNEWDSSKCNSNSGDEYKYTAPIGSFPDGASPYGVMDMAGNVWEWVADWYDEDYYSRSPQQNPQGSDSGSWRVLRGGSWYGDNPLNLRAALRDWNFPESRVNNIGFRGVALRFPR